MSALDILYSGGDDSIILCDPVSHVDIAEVFHSERATVPTTPEQALVTAMLFANAAMLVDALEAARDWLRAAPLQSGVCCCGSSVEDHSMGDGHSPVDELSYSAMQLEQRIDAALAIMESRR